MPAFTQDQGRGAPGAGFAVARSVGRAGDPLVLAVACSAACAARVSSGEGVFDDTGGALAASAGTRPRASSPSSRAARPGINRRTTVEITS